MKTLKTFFFSFLFIIVAQVGFAQAEKQETFKVSGECGMCKKKIEAAAKKAGATAATWNVETKVLTVAYKPETANADKILQSVASAGYDTERVKATDEAYNKLHECCQYDRAAGTAKEASCCVKASCSKEANCCAKDGCTKDAACCKEHSCTNNCCPKA